MSPAPSPWAVTADDQLVMDAYDVGPMATVSTDCRTTYTAPCPGCGRDVPWRAVFLVTGYRSLALPLPHSDCP